MSQEGGESMDRVPHSHGSEIVEQLLAHESAFRRFVRRRVGESALAEDLLQQSLTRALERHHSLQNKESIVAWFHRILQHTIVDYYRSQSAEARRDEGFLRDLTVSGQDTEPAVDEVKAAVCSCLHEILPTLRPSYGELLRRIDLGGESPQTVAQELKVTHNNLTVRLHRARQALRSELENACGICSKHGCMQCTCS